MLNNDAMKGVHKTEEKSLPTEWVCCIKKMVNSPFDKQIYTHTLQRTHTYKITDKVSSCLSNGLNVYY